MDTTLIYKLCSSNNGPVFNFFEARSIVFMAQMTSLSQTVQCHLVMNYLLCVNGFVAKN